MVQPRQDRDAWRRMCRKVLNDTQKEVRRLQMKLRATRGDPGVAGELNATRRMLKEWNKSLLAADPDAVPVEVEPGPPVAPGSG